MGATLARVLPVFVSLLALGGGCSSDESNGTGHGSGGTGTDAGASGGTGAGGGTGATGASSGAGGTGASGGTGGTAGSAGAPAGGGAGAGGIETGGTAGSAGSPAGGSAGADAGGEDCTNGVDDDGDGLIDCADPKCNAGFTCVPAATGWTYGARYDSSQQCSGEQALDACNPPCSACAVKTYAECGLWAKVYDHADCTGNTLMSHADKFPHTVCGTGAQPAASGSTIGYTATPTLILNPVCASPGTPTKSAYFCPAVGGHCQDPSMVCVPKPASGGGACVEKAGNSACPQGYPTQTVAYPQGKAACTCTCSASNGPCPGSISGGELFADAFGGTACLGLPLMMTGDGQCHDSGFTGYGGMAWPKSTVLTGTSCSGPTFAPSGQMTTVCCE